MKKWLVAFLTVLTSSGIARATTMLPMYLDDLTAVSQTVVYGKVMASRTEWDDAHHLIYTVYTVTPNEYLKGQLGSSFELRQLGGEKDGVGLYVAGEPKFEIGEEDVLFVWTDPKGNNQVSAMEQGVVPVTIDSSGTKIAARPIALGSARALTSPAASLPGTSRSLPELLDEIRSSIAKTSQGKAGQ